ncbi:MAG: hypothetical protein PUK70_03780 [Bacteroidales bacterium]|nr:hypothetical protein [Bacteroidales bacterium]MDY6000866.1 hypothetical protein [Candidatus Cryptobacteroides sp.]
MSYLSILDGNGDQNPMGLEVIFPSLTPVLVNWVGNAVLHSRPYGSTTPLPLNLDHHDKGDSVNRLLLERVWRQANVVCSAF